MFGTGVLANGLLKIGGDLLTRLFPDPAVRREHELKLLNLQQEGQLKEVETSMSAIMAEAQSEDKWTSRARPSFLYVIYIMILAAIPMGLFYMIDIDKAEAMVRGVEVWLEAIPEPMWTLFGAGYLGYTGSRSFDKKQKLKNELDSIKGVKY